MPTIEDAIILAAEAHRGHLEKRGKPYITHPLRVMLKVESPLEQMAAVLHDVVEDSDLTIEDLRQRGFPREVVDAVDCLTKREGEAYEHLIERAAGNAIARQVKLADLEDNMNVLRLPELTEELCRKLRKYRAAWERLTNR
jgi:(p)ppGpp synthase/HD superfamily hydrolase